MKKIYLAFIILSVSVGSLAQGKFSATVTNTDNLLTFKIKPDVTTTTGFSGIEFFLRYPTSSAPFSYGLVTVNTTDFPGMQGNGTIGGGAAGSGQWEIIHNDPNVAAIPGYNVDHFLYTAPATITTSASYTGGTSYDVISVYLIGTPPAQVDFQFISDDSYATSYLALTDQNGGDLLPGSLNNYFFPTTSTTPEGAGTIYYMNLLDVPLPVKFLNFTATKDANAALLNWAVENEDANTVSYQVETSVNGADFTPYKTIPALNNGRGSNVYNFTVENLSAIHATGAIYFRIKQTDRDGKYVYSQIRSVRLEGKGLLVGVYPNPVKNTANVTIDLDANAAVSVSILDASGKQLSIQQLQGIKGANITKVDMSKMATGSYSLKVQTTTEVKVIPVVKAAN
jgi:hypothetical protein